MYVIVFFMFFLLIASFLKAKKKTHHPFWCRVSDLLTFPPHLKLAIFSDNKNPGDFLATHWVFFSTKYKFMGILATPPKANPPRNKALLRVINHWFPLIRPY